jgi:collagenase-like PrtC family protease
VEAGASELYCGLLEPWWQERYGNHDSVSRRQGAANLASRDELAHVVEQAAQRKVPVYLTVNVRYTEPQLDYLVGLCTAFEKMGGTGLQISDIGLLNRLKGTTSLRLCLSLLAVADNIPTIDAFHSLLGISRVVLPRFITPREAAALLAPFPSLEAEVMAFFDKCPFVDGYCRNYHGVAYPTWTGEDTQGPPPLYTFDTTFVTHSCLGTKQHYLQSHPCAACTLPRFEKAGVGFSKIGGRGRPLASRISALRFLKQAASLPDNAGRALLYKQSFDQHCQCYYEEAQQQRTCISPVTATLPPTGVWLGFQAQPPAGCERVYIGSETDRATVGRLLENWEWVASLAPPVTLVLPPLSQGQLDSLHLLTRLLNAEPHSGMRLCLNDVGSLHAAYRNREKGAPYALSIGTLLARVDDPAAYARFLDPNMNPQRTVVGPDERPRLLTWAPPPKELVRHWHSPSALEPSARSFFEQILGEQELIYEFS